MSKHLKLNQTRKQVSSLLQVGLLSFKRLTNKFKIQFFCCVLTLVFTMMYFMCLQQLLHYIGLNIMQSTHNYTLQSRLVIILFFFTHSIFIQEVRLPVK